MRCGRWPGTTAGNRVVTEWQLANDSGGDSAAVAPATGTEEEKEC